MSYYIHINGKPLCESGSVFYSEHCCVTFRRHAEQIAARLRAAFPRSTIVVQKGTCPTMRGQ